MQHYLGKLYCQSKSIALVQKISLHPRDIDIVQSVVGVRNSPQLQNNVCVDREGTFSPVKI